MRIERQTRSRRNRVVALNIYRQRLKDEQHARSLQNKNIALARFALHEAIASLPQLLEGILETNEEDIDV